MATKPSVSKHKRDFHDFLEKLNFTGYFPQKLTLQDFLVISNDIKPNVAAGTTNPHHLLPLMLEQIKMTNYQFKKVLLYEQTARASTTSADVDSDGSEDEDIDKIILHPMDCLLVLIHCADNFLRQEIFSKLISCQVAIPLLLPDPPPSSDIVLPLWAMRSIVKSWKTKTSESTWIPHEGRLVDCSVPMVSFMRLNRPGFSKSKILNSVIDDSKLDFFFNYECEGSSAERKFVDGLVEACWYLPAGEKSDVFDNLIMFTNLHGDAGNESNGRQLTFLLDHSFICFVFVFEKDILSKKHFQRFKSSPGKVFFLVSSCSKSKMEEVKQRASNCAVIELAKKEPAAIVKSIRTRIKSRSSTCNADHNGTPLCHLSHYTMSSLDQFLINVDETKCEPCCKSRKNTEKIMAQIEDTREKEEMLPLQGPALWHQWANQYKAKKRAKQEHIGETSLYFFNEELKRKLIEIRKKQCTKAKTPSKLLLNFISSLSECSKEERAYFLQWLKFCLDDHSFKKLCDLKEVCDVTRDKLRMNDIPEEKRKQLQKELNAQDTRLVNASFGIEHFFRELGQMYESIMEVEENLDERDRVKQFPKIVAELLLSGQPFEIVDGDAAHIPIKWIQAVLNEVKKLIGNSKLFVLSVLGIQSTGKSTLMNTMFGVQFSVSAGRCTRGAYLHLLEVKAAKSKCDYMLIIDTEGLRAPEFDYHSQTQHDNELAALVIGLADVTIVNMFGEVPADISDILQTTVHAFIRMKKAEMEPSCQFVRHCVASVSASKTREGIDKFQETLDRMTKLAAKAEHYEGQFQQFSDVITFDNKTDVQNFHNLWHGNPPMAPVNPLYCQDADALRNKLLQLTVDSYISLCSLRDFQIRLETLWEAILKENFVFSFKNTLELEAFNCLDTEYGKWSWRLQDCYVRWVGDAVTAFSSESSLDSLTTKSNEQIQEIHKTLDKKYGDIMKSVDKFFEDTNPMIADTMIKWKAEYEIKIGRLKEDHKRNAIQNCNDFIERRRAITKVVEIKNHERENIERKLKQLISETKVTGGTEFSDEDLKAIENKFNKQWEEWIKDIERTHPLPKIHDIHFRITYCLRNNCHLTSYDTILVEEEEKKSLANRGRISLRVPIDVSKHLNIGRMQQLKKFFFSSDGYNLAERETQKILKANQDRLSKLDMPYEDHHITSFVRDILLAINEFESREDVPFTFTAEYRIDLIMEVAGYALKVFLKIQQKLIDEHPTKYLKSLRPIYEQKFHALCNVTVQEKALAISLVNRVEAGTIFSLKEKLKGDLPDEVRASHSLFESKKSLIGHVLLSLLRKKSFDQYKVYLQNISQGFQDFIKEYIQDYCAKQENEKRRIVYIAERHLGKKMTLIQEAAEDAESSQQLEEWLMTFHKNVSSTIQLEGEELKFLLPDDPVVLEDCDVKFFTKEFIKELHKCHDKLKDSLSDPDNKVLQVLDEVAEVLRDSVAGCCEQRSIL